MGDYYGAVDYDGGEGEVEAEIIQGNGEDSEGAVTATIYEGDDNDTGKQYYEIDVENSEHIDLAHELIDASDNTKDREQMRQLLLEADPRLEIGATSHALKTRLNSGETYCLITSTWANQFKDYLENVPNASRPGSVDNEPLFDQTFVASRLKKHMKIGKDFVAVTSPVWDLIVEWFGGGPKVERSCPRLQNKIDLVGCDLLAFSSKHPGKYRRVYYPKTATVRELKVGLCKLFDLDPKDVRLYDYFNYKPHARIDEIGSDKDPLSGKNLVESNPVMVESPLESGKYRITTARSYGGYQRYEDDVDKVTGRRPEVSGATGLSNMGNTCYMASTLQCLSNIPKMKEYFVTGDYKADINEDNPLGYKGKMAEAYGNVMEKMWGDEGNCVEARGFKSVISELKEEFAGYEQHDSQEFLSQLLDGLHEDLNRIKQKPPTETPSANGRPDDVVAAESLKVHKLRNDSLIQDLFSGMFKSTVTCPNQACKNVSVTFDPYSILPLPLKTQEEQYHQLHIVFVNKGPNFEQNKPIVEKFNVTAPKHGPVFLLRRIVAKQKGIDLRNIMLTMSVGDSFNRRGLADSDDLAALSSSNAIVAFELNNVDHFLDCMDQSDQNWRRTLLISPERYEEEEEKESSDGYDSPGELKDLDDLDSPKPQEKSKASNKSEPEAEDDINTEIGFVNCPWVVGDIWQGHYLFGDSEQLVRIEVTGVKQEDKDNFSIEAVFDTREDTIPEIQKNKSQSVFNVTGTYTRINTQNDSKSKNKKMSKIASKKEMKAKKKKSTKRWSNAGLFGGRSKKAQKAEAKSGDPEEEEKIEEAFMDGTITFTPTSQVATIKKGESRGYGGYSRYSPRYNDDEGEETRNPIWTIGSVDKYHKFFWGKVQNELEHVRGEFIIKRMESRAWRTYAPPTTQKTQKSGRGTKKAKAPKNELKVMFDVPRLVPWDNRVVVFIQHQKKRTGKTKSSYYRANNPNQSFMVPSLMFVQDESTEAQFYKKIQSLFVGYLNASGEAMVVEEMMAKVKFVRSNHKFETRCDTKQKERLKVGETIEENSETKLMPSQDTNHLWIVADWGEEECPFEKVIDKGLLMVPNKSETLNIISAIELFSREEKLSQNNQWYCSKCQLFQEAYKKLEIYSVPPVLVVQFKRFSQQEGRNRADKLETPVNFPIRDLDISKFVISKDAKDREKYDLVAVSSHYGILGLGHYTAKARNELSGDWYSFNDSTVTRLSEENHGRICDPSAYVIFYLRKDLIPESWKEMNAAAETTGAKAKEAAKSK